jgi:hypothetical protein
MGRGTGGRAATGYVATAQPTHSLALNTHSASGRPAPNARPAPNGIDLDLGAAPSAADDAQFESY